MKIRYRLVQSFTRIVREQTLEFAECSGGIGKGLRVVYRLAGVSAGDEVVAAPAVPVSVPVIGLAVGGEIYVETFTLRVSAVVNDYLSEMFRDSNDIFHKLVGIFKDIGVDELKKI